jgi:threonine aldolase
MFGREAALYCPSGTMTNQIAVNVHTKPGDEVICDKLSHVYNYEGGGIAFNSGASVRLLNGDRGRFSAQDVLDNINPEDPHFPVSKLVTVENTCNKGGGSFWEIEEIRRIRDVCIENNLKMHLDGARLFNALVETGDNMLDYGKLFDSISICLSKGLGAPVGSVLIGDLDFINQARRVRKVFGGGMRQAGFLAAACIYALENNIDRLKEDHRRAKMIGGVLSGLSYVKEVMPVDTNIVVAEIVDKFDSNVLIDELKEKGILVVGFGKQKIRMVTHLDFDDDMLEEFVGRL